MNLSNWDLSLGVVVSCEDPKNLGRIKVNGVDVATPEMNYEHLPWCAPFSCSGYQRISKPVLGQKVWVLHNNENYYEYYYIPAWEINTNTALINSEDDYDVLVSRPGDGLGSQMLYNDREGFVTRIGNDISQTVNSDGTLISTDGTVEFGIKESVVRAGKVNQEYQPMVLGEELQKLLDNLASKLLAAADAAKNNCYTTTLFKPLMDCSEAISKYDTKKILSDNAKIN